MARKTKAQLMAERDALRNAQIAEARAGYPARLMAALERLNKLGGDVRVRNGMFDTTLNNEGFILALEYDGVSDEVLYDLEYTLDREEEQAVEAERKAMLRRAALNKLSEEEREVLGI